MLGRVHWLFVTAGTQVEKCRIMIKLLVFVGRKLLPLIRENFNCFLLLYFGYVTLYWQSYKACLKVGIHVLGDFLGTNVYYLSFMCFFLSTNSNEIKWYHSRGGPTLIQHNDVHKVPFHLHTNQIDLLLSISSLPIIKKNNKDQPL